MGSIKPIGTIAECYAHAVAVEREGAARYAEFAELMAERGEESTAGLFERLARFDAEHAQGLAERTARMSLPRLSPVEHSWVDAAPAGRVSHELLQLMSPYDALKIALDSKRRALEFFERVAASSSDPQTRGLAAEMTADGTQHVRTLEQALAHTPRPLLPDEDSLAFLPH